jgi:signal transduction histidine kinase
VGRRRSGEEFPIECSLTSVETADGPMVCAFLRDLTSSREMEAALRQVQQLEAISRMAAGIAHEINTPVQCIQDSLEFLRESFDGLVSVVSGYRELAAAAAAEHAELIDRIRGAEQDADLDYVMEASPPAVRRALDMARRIVAIVRATKDFAGPEGGAGTVDLHSTLRTVLDLSRPIYADVAEVELDAEPLSVPGHAGELNEAFRHLVVNAAHAIADAGRRGTIRVAARADGDDVVVSVSDDGCGVAPDIAHRIFDPFFTTKEVGRGVGLGLFVASAAARHHNGMLTFESEPGRGSTFRLRMSRDRSASAG